VLCYAVLCLLVDIYVIWCGKQCFIDLVLQVAACGPTRQEKACIMGVPLSMQGTEKRNFTCNSCHTGNILNLRLCYVLVTRNPLNKDT
jgi:hypothetical protein